MIFVGGVPFHSNSTNEGSSDVVELMEHPALISAALSFKAVPEKKFSFSETSSSSSEEEEMTNRKHVYVFQREYATVDPSLVDLIGTDEATTCVGVVIRNRDNGMTSVAHMDSPKVVDIGLSQMLLKLVDDEVDTEMDVHLIGGFEDRLSEVDHSHSLCAKIVEALHKSALRFHIQTFFVLSHNTRTDSNGNTLPIVAGFLVETRSGAIIPAIFDETTRCPDELVRRVRVSASFEDPYWKGRLLDTYDPKTDQFVIAPCSWSVRMVHIAAYVLQLSDSEVLQTCSTSPFAEAPDFVYNERRLFNYLIRHPNWKETFQMGQPRVFMRTSNREWIMVEPAHKA